MKYLLDLAIILTLPSFHFRQTTTDHRPSDNRQLRHSTTISSNNTTKGTSTKMQYSALVALFSALMASGASAQLLPGYELDPVQAAAMGPSMAAPWAGSSSTPRASTSTPSRPTLVPMASSMKPHSKASMAPHMPTPIKPSMAPMAPFMAHSAFASPSFHSIPLKPSASPSSRFSKGVNRNQGANRPHKGSHSSSGSKHALEKPSSEWHNVDGMSQGSNGVGNTAGMGQNQNQNNNGFNGNQANTPNDAPIPGQDSPKPHAAPSDHPIPGMGQNQPKPQEQEQDQPTQAPQPAPQAPPQAPQPNEENQPEPEHPTPTAGQNKPNQAAPSPQAPPTAHPTQGATPNANQSPNTPNQDSSEQSSPPPPHGGLAPVNPMQPGTDVAPMGFDHKKHGQDNGNAFCLGQCFPSKEAAKCGEPYVSLPPPHDLI